MLGVIFMLIRGPGLGIPGIDWYVGVGVAEWTDEGDFLRPSDGVSEVVVIGSLTGAVASEILKIVGLARHEGDIEFGKAVNRQLNMETGTAAVTGKRFTLKGQDVPAAEVGGIVRICSGEESGGSTVGANFGAIENFLGNEAHTTLAFAGTSPSLSARTSLGATAIEWVLQATVAGQDIRFVSADDILFQPGRIFKNEGAQGFNRNPTITSAASPYTVIATDHVLGVDVTGGPVTIDLPAVAVSVDRHLIVKDERGASATNNITLDPSGAEFIEAAATFVISTNKGAVSLYCDGTVWHVY